MASTVRPVVSSRIVPSRSAISARTAASRSTKTQCAFHAGIGEFGQRARHAFERPGAGNVGERDGERGAALGDAQARHRVGFTGGFCGGQREQDGVRDGGVRTIGKECGQQRVLAQRQPGEERTVAEDGFENETVGVRRMKTTLRQRFEGALGASRIVGRDGGHPPNVERFAPTVSADGRRF